MERRIIVDRNVPVPMRDGTLLRADVYRIQQEARLPAILCRLPYDKGDVQMYEEAIHPIQAAEAGYAVVYQDTRGRFQSDGDFYPFFHEAKDGYDTIEWVAAQPWCDGNVGMAGASYFGATQWLAAIEQPPHLKSMIPCVTSSEYYEGWTYQGGAFQLGFMILWAMVFAPDTVSRLVNAGEIDRGQLRRILLASDQQDDLCRQLPLADLSIFRENVAAYFFDWLAHETNDEYWRSIAVNRAYPRIQVPALNIGGWYDIFLHGTLENFVRMRAEGGTAVARSGQRLLIGPWAHANFSSEYFGYGYGILSSFAGIDIHHTRLRYFDHFLKGRENGVAEASPVRVFVMGENTWRDEDEWPLGRTKYMPWYLHSQGQANTSGGTLSAQMPESEPWDVYLYDPRQPVPTCGGATLLPGMRQSANSGPRDQQDVEARPDVLTYTSEALDFSLEVTGPLIFRLWAATSATDTDFVLRLCDVWPDGSSRLLTEGILRARFRNGYEDPTLVDPGAVVEYEINLVATANVFLPGHRIRIGITSSSFPRFDPNPNTGHALGADSAPDLIPALQTIFHDAEHPSHIILPVIPG